MMVTQNIVEIMTFKMNESKGYRQTIRSIGGAVPDNGSFSLFTPISFTNNLDLCGPITGRPFPGSPPFSPPPPFVPPPPIFAPGNGATGAIAGGVAAGAALLFTVPAIAFAWWRRKKPQEYFFDVLAEEDPEVHLGQLKRFSLRCYKLQLIVLAIKIFWVEVDLVRYTKDAWQMEHWWLLNGLRRSVLLEGSCNFKQLLI